MSINIFVDTAQSSFYSKVGSLNKTFHRVIAIIGLFSPFVVYSDDSKQTVDIAIRQVHARSLAASCAACHGTDGNSTGITSNISHIDKAYFVSQMLAFKSGGRPATVMHHHAKGLSTQEIEDLAEYFSTQSRLPVSAIGSQQLSKAYPN